jgi:hypothetical protein
MRQNTATNVGMLHESRYTSIAMLRLQSRVQFSVAVPRRAVAGMTATQMHQRRRFSALAPNFEPQQPPGFVAVARAGAAATIVRRQDRRVWRRAVSHGRTQFFAPILFLALVCPLHSFPVKVLPSHFLCRPGHVTSVTPL